MILFADEKPRSAPSIMLNVCVCVCFSKFFSFGGGMVYQGCVRRGLNSHTTTLLRVFRNTVTSFYRKM